RVQTPILGLVVARDRLIASHNKQHYFIVNAVFDYANTRVKASLITNDSMSLDDKGRLIEKSEADNIARELPGKTGTVSSAKVAEKSEPPPLPYDLLELQADAFKKHGTKPDQTLKITQSLREKLLITYNRSDCRYLNKVQHSDAPAVLDAVANNL